MAAGGELFERSGNVYRAHRLMSEWITGVEKGSRFSFSVEHLKRIHAQVADGQIENNGAFRNHDVAINGSPHRPPSFLEVQAHVDSMFTYLRDNWDSKDMIHLAAFVLWRLLWIHPFSDGNGRTSRAVCYLVLCLKNGRHLPGEPTVLVQMMDARQAYCDALRACDVAFQHTQSVDAAVEPLAQMIGAMLIRQLSS
jgi:Fic family protein